MDTNSVSIRIFDSNLKFLGEVDNFTSLFYIRKWNTYGEFEFHLSKFDAHLIKKGNIIMLNNDGSRSGIIEHIEISNEGQEDITVKGYSLLYMLFQRITVPPVGISYDVFNTNIKDIMEKLVTSNAINPVNEKRKINQLILGTSGVKELGANLSFQTRYKSLGEEIVNLSKTSGLGVSIDLDYKNSKFVFKVIEGRDLSASQSINSPAIFSVEYDNIKSQTYTDSNVDYKNCGYIAGKGDGADRELVILNNNTFTGLNRREVFIDARDASDDKISLDDRGVVILSDTPEIKSFECEVEPSGYRCSWDLGYIVTTVSKKYGMKFENTVAEIKETYEGGVVKIEPTFGEVIKTIAEKVKSNSNSSQESSQGEKGETGIKGDTGATGIQGPAGKEGTQIIVQNTQPTLLTGGVWIQI